MIENLTCPLCGGPMASRANRSSGQRFWGCKKFPDCKGTRNTDGEAPIRETSQRGVRPHEDERGLPSERARQKDSGRWRQP